MHKPIVLDIETQNSFREVGKYDPGLLKISVAAIYDYSVDKFEVFEEKELTRMWPILEKASQIIGFNIDHFDIPVLKQYYLGRISQFKTLDLMNEIEKNLGHRISLDDLVKETLSVGKSGHGLLAIEYFKAGEINKLKEYCIKDVELTKKLYEYGRDHGQVYFKNYLGRQTVNVNWGKNDDAQSQVNLTIPW